MNSIASEVLSRVVHQVFAENGVGLLLVALFSYFKEVLGLYTSCLAQYADNGSLDGFIRVV